jgi:hypothetical protein
MSMTMPIKSTLPDGGILLSAARGSFTFHRLCPDALLVTITGDDTGQFGSEALDQIRLELQRRRPLHLLIDAGAATMVSVQVSQVWSRFFADHRDSLQRVSVLTGSKLVNLAVAIAQHLSRTGNLIQIYSDRKVFEEAMSQVVMRGALDKARALS